MTAIEEQVKMAAKLSQGVRQSGDNKDLEPMLHLVMPDGSVTIVALVIEGAGRDIARAARTAILKIEPQHAVLITEGWTQRKGLSLDDPDMRAVMAGELRPSQLPPHKRGEQLTVLGESATGERAYATYYIERDGTFSETMTSWTLPDDGKSEMVTHFYPLFLAETLIRDLSPEDRANMFDLAGSEKRGIELARAVALDLIAAGRLGDPLGYTEKYDKLREETRERIGWRKGKRS